MPRRNPNSASTPITLGVAQPTPPYEMLTYTVEVNQHSVYMSDAIQSPNEYIELIHALRSAGPNDEFVIYLNTEGGRVDAGLQIINAMNDSEAHIITVLDPQAYSMGAIMFLASDEHVVPDNAQLMFHNYSSGLLGKGNEQLAEVKFASRTFEKLFTSVCTPFLSREEIGNIMNGQDLWLDAEEIRKRLKRAAAAAAAAAAAVASGVAAPRGRRKKADAVPAAPVAAE